MPAPITATPTGSVAGSSVTGMVLSARRLQQGVSGVLQALHLAEFGVLVLDVDRHAGVDRLQRVEEAGPPAHVMPAADRDEVPRRVLRPATERVRTAEAEPPRVV